MFKNKNLIEKILDRNYDYSYSEEKTSIEKDNIKSKENIILEDENVTIINNGNNNVVIKGNCKTISTINGKIIINGKEIDKTNYIHTEHINIIVEGNVTSIDSAYGDITVKDNVLGDIKSNGSIDISGNVGGNIKANGNVIVTGNVEGNINSNGNISIKKG